MRTLKEWSESVKVQHAIMAQINHPAESYGTN